MSAESLLHVIGADPAPARKRGGRTSLIIVGIAIFLAANFALYLTAPDMFDVDLGKGLYTQANNLELTRVYQRAIPLYEEVIQRFPDSRYVALARIGIANSNKGLGHLDEAKEQYTQLLSSLHPGPEFDSLRLEILTNLAALYRDNSDVENFRKIFAELDEHYPGSDAVSEGRTYLDSQTAAAEAAGSAIPADFQFTIGTGDVVMPTSAKVGDSIDVHIRVAPVAGPTGAFSLMTNLDFWTAFTVVRIDPNPEGVSDFWGQRAWKFAGISEPVEIVATLQAIVPGTYEFKLGLEQNYDITELGIVKTIQVGK